jgi:hypothetical protein
LRINRYDPRKTSCVLFPSIRLYTNSPSLYRRGI